ncbi:c-type cytochrome [Novosphingobium lentum]|uniref:c-type cytochrome n=1 Tax=Novosphingobium lentum TaxID=145287 RepID=UPI000830BFA8|nr:cytochrome c family protein [Novosphingobium lentum]
MDDRFNTIAGWTLFGGIVALGFASISSHYYEADKSHHPEKMGYAIEGVEAEGGGAAAEKALPLPQLLAAGDPAKGEAIFAKCKACHTIDQGGANGIGPNLYGVVGEGVASGRGGFAFSDALKKHAGKWDFDTLNEWLTSPKKMADGTKMSFAGLPKAEDRANVILYLNKQGSNLPLPKADAAPAAADAKAPAADAKADPKAAAAAPAAGAKPAAATPAAAPAAK